MWRVVALHVLSIFALLGCEAAHEIFPELQPCSPPPDGFKLTFRDGPDFYVWALESDSDRMDERTAILYVGVHPSPEASAEAVRAKGQLANQAVQWAEWTKDGRTYSEAIVEYKHDRDSLRVDLHSVVAVPAKLDDQPLRNWLASVELCPKPARVGDRRRDSARN